MKRPSFGPVALAMWLLPALRSPHRLLCARLLWMSFWDQRMRFALMDRMSGIDEANTRRMRALIGRYGWPGRDLVGEQGATAAWLLVQHADHDPEFQARCLELVREAAQRNAASVENLAYLEDRVRLHQGRPQLYGTQLESRSGRLQLQELEDPEHVDERRAALGLGPLADNVAEVQQMQSGSASWSDWHQQ
jgi:hypothetical protein